MDVVFLLDKSSSMSTIPGQDRWLNTQLFVDRILDTLMSRSTNIRVGVTVYDSSATHVVFLVDSPNLSRQEIVNRLFSYQAQGATSTANGILSVMRDQFTQSGGDRNFAPVSRLIIGRSTGP